MDDDWVILGGSMTPPWDDMGDGSDLDKRTTAGAKRGPRRSRLALRRKRLTDWLEAHPPDGVSEEEVQAHVQCMPERYWETVNKEDLHWHLKVLHTFLGKLAAPDSSGAPIAIESRTIPGSNRCQVIFCSWDRRGLLEQVAAAFSALRMDILRAEVYTRDDKLVFDLFEVVEQEVDSGLDDKRLQELLFLVEGAFSNPPRFVSVWATQFHKEMPKQKERTPRISFDNRSSSEHTVLRVEASDRLGLLYDLLHALTEQGLAINQAVVNTMKRTAVDQFHLVNGDGFKITGLSRLGKLRKVLAEAVLS